MFDIAFSILIVMAVLIIFSNLAMRIRLTKWARSGNKLVWWRRSSDQVLASYEELFPRSPLLVFLLLVQLGLAIALATALIFLVVHLWKSA